MNLESVGGYADHWATRHFIAAELQYKSHEQNLVLFNALPNFLVARLHQFNKV